MSAFLRNIGQVSKAEAVSLGTRFGRRRVGGKLFRNIGPLRGISGASSGGYQGALVAGYRAWWRGDGYVSGTWTDRSANGYNLTEATNPPALISADANFNGLPTVDFDGTNDILGGTTLSNLIAADAFHIFGVVRAESFGAADGSGANQRGVFADTGGYVGFGFGSSKLEGFNYDGTTDYTGNPVVDLSTLYGFHLRHDAGTLYLNVSGKTEASVVSGNTSDMTNAFRVGVAYDGSPFFDGQIGDLGVYNVVKSGADLTTNLAYYADTYGITW